MITGVVRLARRNASRWDFEPDEEDDEEDDDDDDEDAADVTAIATARMKMRMLDMERGLSAGDTPVYSVWTVHEGECRRDLLLKVFSLFLVNPVSCTLFFYSKASLPGDGRKKRLSTS